MKKFLILIVGALIYSINGFSKPIDSTNIRYWIAGGVGGYRTLDKVGGITWNADLNFMHNRTLFKIKLLTHEEIQVFGPAPNETASHVGLLIGGGFSDKYIHLYFSAGLGITGGVKRGNYLYSDPSANTWDISNRQHFERDKYITPSIPLEVDFLIKPIKNLGLGMGLFADLNLKQPLYGFVVKLALGKLR